MTRKFKDIADYFTFEERLNTVGAKGINLKDFWDNFYALLGKHSIENIYLYYEKNHQNLCDLKRSNFIYNLFNGSISNMSIFKIVYKTIASCLT